MGKNKGSNNSEPRQDSSMVSGDAEATMSTAPKQGKSGGKGGKGKGSGGGK